MSNEQDLPGRYARQGQIIGYVVDPSDRVTLRVVVPQDEIGLVRRDTKRVHVMPRQWRGDSIEAVVLREVPGGTNQLPTAALGVAGGGSIVVDPRDPDGRETMQRIFEIEVGLPGEVAFEHLGMRMDVRFDHGYEPAGLQIYRALRQLFLRTFGV